MSRASQPVSHLCQKAELISCTVRPHLGWEGEGVIQYEWRIFWRAWGWRWGVEGGGADGGRKGRGGGGWKRRDFINDGRLFVTSAATNGPFMVTAGTGSVPANASSATRAFRSSRRAINHAGDCVRYGPNYILPGARPPTRCNSPRIIILYSLVALSYTTRSSMRLDFMARRDFQSKQWSDGPKKLWRKSGPFHPLFGKKRSDVLLIPSSSDGVFLTFTKAAICVESIVSMSTRGTCSYMHNYT